MSDFLRGQAPLFCEKRGVLDFKFYHITVDFTRALSWIWETAAKVYKSFRFFTALLFADGGLPKALLGKAAEAYAPSHRATADNDNPLLLHMQEQGMLSKKEGAPLHLQRQASDTELYFSTGFIVGIR